MLSTRPMPVNSHPSVTGLELRPSLGRLLKERLIRLVFLACASSAVLITLATVGMFVAGSLPFFARVSPREFLGGTRWAPLHDPPSFGVLALIADTLVITAIALLVALPFGLLSAVFLSEYAGGLRRVCKPILEILAGVPTVVYGFFALRFVTPLLQRTFLPQLSYWNGLSAGLVMGIMIIPLVASLSEEALFAVPRRLREAAYALGATRFEVIVKVVIPAAFSGIAASFILAMSRAIGETMIVALAAGRTPAWPPDPVQPMLTITTTIVNIATGDHEATAFIWSVLFALGFLLFLSTLAFNVAGHLVLRRFWERYS